MKLQLQNEIKKFKLIIAVVKWWIYCQPLGGRGKTVKISNRKHFLNGIIFTISAACVLVMLIGGVIMGGIAASKFGIGSVLYPSYYALSVAARILFVVAYISFALTMTIYTRNAITGFIFGLLIPNIPKILEMVLGFLKFNIDLDFLKISTHMPSIYAASNDLSSFLLCFVVLSDYLILSIVAGFGLMKNQDIK